MIRLYTHFPQEDFPKQDVLKWQGTIPFQEKLSGGIDPEKFKKKEPTLVHAVTGARKDGDDL